MSGCVTLFKFPIWRHLKHIYFHCFGNSCSVVLYKLFKLLNFILIENFCWVYMHFVSLFPCSSKTFLFFSKDFLITKSKALPRFPWRVLWLITKKTSVASFECIVSTYPVLHSFFWNKTFMNKLLYLNFFEFLVVFSQIWQHYFFTDSRCSIINLGIIIWIS